MSRSDLLSGAANVALDDLRRRSGVADFAFRDTVTADATLNLTVAGRTLRVPVRRGMLAASVAAAVVRAANASTWLRGELAAERVDAPGYHTARLSRVEALAA